METRGQEGNETHPHPADLAPTLHSTVHAGAWLSQEEGEVDTSLRGEVRPPFPPPHPRPPPSREPPPPTSSPTSDTFTSLLSSPTHPAEVGAADPICKKNTEVPEAGTELACHRTLTWPRCGCEPGSL